MGYASIPAFRTMRTLRALRPLRAVSRWEGMRVRSLRQSLLLSLLLMLLIFTFAVFRFVFLDPFVLLLISVKSKRFKHLVPAPVVSRLDFHLVLFVSSGFSDASE